MILLLFFFIIALIIILDIKWTKQDLADYYGICRKTLGKWVRYCSPNISYDKCNRVRKLNVVELLCICYEFGFQEENKAMTKSDIVEKCESDYQTVRENIARNIGKLGMDKKAYLCLDIFPPNLSLQMVEIMG